MSTTRRARFAPPWYVVEFHEGLRKPRYLGTKEGTLRVFPTKQEATVVLQKLRQFPFAKGAVVRQLTLVSWWH